ncbi:SulP family inorganic anion transporter [Cyclobacterium jeungdonense]|uniref:SulP family inorganic anion transporter n=1 Tax=Cyclobacterium jeungdonense TaxID=708087 RepID=A0ABT8C3H9_9BACT|nr:SulP family inorganic anion transporter [Cyclobacterium jeungdonense]MDN3686592.1 SulP family inorganic anion transporter [Cyclobacterium jeungdonense]
MSNKKGIFSNLSSDLPAGLVVFLVALPLCLGIALSSGAPLFSGIIAGIVGGIVVGALSGSHTAVSGPAAGLTVIVLNAIEDLQAYELFLTALVIAGALQLVLGIIKAGVIGYYFPTSVIKGMLAGIGIILIIKQLPFVFGTNSSELVEDFIPLINDFQAVLALQSLMNTLEMGAIIIALFSLAILILWEKPIVKNHSFLKFIPGPLLAVLLSIGINKFFKFIIPDLYIGTENKVTLPEITGFSSLGDHLFFPDFSGVFNPDVWVVAITIAIIASLETLLSLEAADKIDPQKRVSPPNRELLAQGAGNLVNGLVGGMPITAVIVRSSANITSGAKSKMSAIFHGLLLLLSVFLIPNLLNLIPLASLAAILLVIGYKLAKISLFKSMYKLGWDQFLPFVITILGIVFFDLLKGIGMGMIVGIVYILMRNYKNSHFFKDSRQDDEDIVHIILAEEVSFLNKGSLIKTLKHVGDNKRVIIDGTNSKIIDYDVIEVIKDFQINAKERNITVEIINIDKENMPVAN